MSVPRALGLCLLIIALLVVIVALLLAFPLAVRP